MCENPHNYFFHFALWYNRLKLLTYKGKEISWTLFDCDFGTKLKSIEIMKAIDLGHWLNISYDGFNVHSRIVLITTNGFLIFYSAINNFRTSNIWVLTWMMLILNIAYFKGHLKKLEGLPWPKILVKLFKIFKVNFNHGCKSTPTKSEIWIASCTTSNSLKKKQHIPRASNYWTSWRLVKDQK